jgi:hypothetical protein
MQTIVFDSFADGYFKLYRGGAAVFGDEIIGKDKYGRLFTSIENGKEYVQPFFLRPYKPNDDWTPSEDKKMMLEFLGIDYNYVLETTRNGKDLKIPVSKNFKCVFTKNGDIVIYDGDVTPDPVRKTKHVKTLCKWYKEWGKKFSFYEMKEKNPDGFDIDGWEFKKGSKYVICSSFHFLQDLKYMLIPEYFVGELDELYGQSYYHSTWLRCCEILYNVDPIDLNESWDWTDEEKAAIAEAKRIAEEEEDRKRQELEERKNTPGYCRLCGAPDAEYIPFEGMYMCRDCYYDSKY